jgi:hypothetical protein
MGTVGRGAAVEEQTRAPTAHWYRRPSRRPAGILQRFKSIATVFLRVLVTIRRQNKQKITIAERFASIKRLNYQSLRDSFLKIRASTIARSVPNRACCNHIANGLAHNQGLALG